MPEHWPPNLIRVGPADESSPGFWYLPIQQFGHNDPSTVGAGTNKISSKLLGIQELGGGGPRQLPRARLLQEHLCAGSPVSLLHSGKL